MLPPVGDSYSMRCHLLFHVSHLFHFARIFQNGVCNLYATEHAGQFFDALLIGQFMDL